LRAGARPGRGDEDLGAESPERGIRGELHLDRRRRDHGVAVLPGPPAGGARCGAGGAGPPRDRRRPCAVRCQRRPHGCPGRLGRGRQALPLLCLAACVLLCWQPPLAGEPAFQLSLAATAGIVLAARPVEQWLTSVLSRWLPGPVAGIVGAALAVSTTAQMACQ